jgi:hypothetical protein
MTMFFALRVDFEPSAAVTSTAPGPVMRPRPLIHSTLFFLNRNSMPLVRAFTLSCFWPIIWPRFSFGVPTSMPRAGNSFVTASYSSEACSRALDGMQPTFRQVPPRVSRISTQAAFSPN